MDREKKKYIFVYQTKNLITQKTYIGVHTSNKLEDGYIGSGVDSQSSALNRINRECNDRPKRKKVGLPYSVVKHGYENFKREILCFFDTEEDAYEEEAYLVDQKWVDSKDNYNLILGGGLPPIRKGREHSDYISDIYEIDIESKSIIDVHPTAQAYKDYKNYNQACVSSVLRGLRSKYKTSFFTRNPEIWEEERRLILNVFQETRIRQSKLESRPNRAISVDAYNLDETLFKKFDSLTEACAYFGRGRSCKKTITDAINKTGVNGRKITAYGYIWKYADK